MSKRLGPALSLAQWALLAELAEPMSRGQEAWYFAHGKKRTLRKLEEFGYAKFYDESVWKVGYSITEAGRLRFRGLPASAAMNPAPNP